MQINNIHLKKFFAQERVNALLSELNKQSKEFSCKRIGVIRVLLAIFISLLPALSHYLYIYRAEVDITTILVGVATVLSLLFRIRHQIPFSSVKNWNKSLGLTHTAFALGCVPIVILLLISPESLIPPQASPEGGSSTQPSATSVVHFILGVSVWAGLTEEIIYRGLLISVLRRCTIFKDQITRDRMAILLSAVIFGLSHYYLWGPSLSIALIGLGLGFGMAYIAIGELILPLIVYHIMFDVLSLSFAFLAHKI